MVSISKRIHYIVYKFIIKYSFSFQINKLKIIINKLKIILKIILKIYGYFNSFIIFIIIIYYNYFIIFIIIIIYFVILEIF